MSLKDFVRIFTVVEGVFYSARKLEHAKEDLSALKNRHLSAVKSQWTSDTAGGAQGPLWRVNPQFRFEWTRSKGNTSMLWISLCNLTRLGDTCIDAQSRKVFSRIGIQIWRLPSDGKRLVTPLNKYHVTASTYTPKRTCSSVRARSSIFIITRVTRSKSKTYQHSNTHAKITRKLQTQVPYQSI